MSFSTFTSGLSKILFNAVSTITRRIEARAAVQTQNWRNQFSNPLSTAVARSVAYETTLIASKPIHASFTSNKARLHRYRSSKTPIQNFSNFNIRNLIPMGIMSWILGTKMDDVYTVDKYCRVSDGKRTYEEAKMENMLISFLMWLPDSDWIENWDYCMQTLMRISLSRMDEDDPIYGPFTSIVIEELILSKRKLLPSSMNVSTGMIIVYNQLARQYTETRQWQKLIALSELHIQELSHVEIGRVPEQKSLVYLQMAGAYNLAHDPEMATQTLDRCLNVFQLEYLPPHRFKAHLINIVELCYNHDRIEIPRFLGMHFNAATGEWDLSARPGVSQPSASLPPSTIKCISFLEHVEEWYASLQTQLPSVLYDFPWSHLMKAVETQVEKTLEETRKQMSEREIEEKKVLELQMIAAQRSEFYFKKILTDPKYTPKERIRIMEKLMNDSAINQDQVDQMRAFIRKLRVAEALQGEYHGPAHDKEFIKGKRY